jgi:hypothetical protein
VSLFKRRGKDSGEEFETDRADESIDDDLEVDEPDQPAARASSSDRSSGPYDLGEVDDTSEMLDLGALRVPPAPDMELRLDLDESGEHVVGATIVVADSAAQVQVFAAPRTEGIWDDVRAEIAGSVTQQGGTADEQDGVFGRELLARVPSPTPDGRTSFQPARFTGVDGPRWFLRAVFTGRAATEEDSALDVERIVRSLVVVRGDEAMAPRDLLALQLPQIAMEGSEGAGEDGTDAPDGTDTPGMPRRLAERGPEITEIR